MLALRSLRPKLRALSTVPQAAPLSPVMTEADLKRMKRIEAPRRAIVLEYQKAAKEGKIIPMIHILEKIQEAIKSPEPTPMQKLQTALNIQPTDSFELFLEKKRTVYGSFALDLYGSEKDHHYEALMARGEIVPSIVRSEDDMQQYRRYFAVNFNVPGAIENINPNKFIRMKPIEEFDYLPIIPIAPSTMQRYRQDWEKKRKRGYKFSINKARAWSAGIGVISFVIFLFLIYFLYRTDEESWVAIEKARIRTDKYKTL